MKTIFMFVFAVIHTALGYFTENSPEVFFLSSQVWLVGGILAIGDKR